MGSLVKPIKIAQLRWFGHMKMMTDNRLPKKIYEQMSKVWKKRARAKLTWTQGIAETMREQELEDRIWEDRAGWRVATNS